MGFSFFDLVSVQVSFRNWTSRFVDGIASRRDRREASLDKLPVVSSVTDGVDEGGFALLDLLDGAFNRRTEVVGVFERAFGVPAHRSCQTREVGIGIVEIHADVRARRIGAASFGENDLMVPV